MTGFGRYFVPGPAEVHPEVLAAMARPVIHHRSPEARELFERIQPGLRALFGTARPVYVFASSGTGVVEAGLRALPRAKVLALVNGAFSDRFARIAAACGHAVECVEKPWGEVHAPAEIEVTDHQAVLAVHSETSTGALQPIAELARAVEVPLLVDSISGVGGVALDLDASGLAYACTGSQKALALPPGLGFAVASAQLLRRATHAGARGLYFDLLEYERRTPPFTPALSLLYALARQLERIEREGLAARFERHRRMAERTWDWVETARERLGVELRVLAPAGFRSPTVTCIRLPDGRVGPEIVRRIAERGYTVGGGYGPLKPTTFRIGHMGDQTLATLEGLLAACDAALAG
ncbi:MAG: pyridoxal-phosphate-dependent aminotransferase family protein [Planctomycetota bacterium]